MKYFFLLYFSCSSSTIKSSKIYIKENIYIEPIAKSTLHAFYNLSQAYEAEFSNLTNKKPNKNGIFLADTLPVKPYLGFIIFMDTIPVGFAIINLSEIIYDVSEFYIIPSFRKQHIGEIFATTLFNKHKGSWQVRQIQGATKAIRFWRKVIGKYTNEKYQEDFIEDKTWGLVTRQQFNNSNIH